MYALELDKDGIPIRVDGLPVVFCESDICKWFEENFKALDFQKISEPQSIGPDYITTDKGGNVKKVEIEYLSSRFLMHKHDVRKVDFVICGKKDKGIDGTITIELHGKYVFCWFEEIASPCSFYLKKVSVDRVMSGWYWDKLYGIRHIERKITLLAPS